MNYDGTVVINTKLDTIGIENGMKDIEKRLMQTEKNTSNMISKMIKGFLGLKVIGTVFSSITSQMDNAISRVDTMANYSKVMANLGIASEDAQASIQVLSEKLQGLPTTLNDAASAVQRFASANSNVKASTEIFLALNNAILAGGADMQIQRSALEQLSQAYAKGKPDMMEWRTAMMAMPAQLKQTAIAMGYVSADALGEALRSGKVSMNEFMVTLIKLNKEGVNGFKSFEEQALNSTGGIQTSITNMKTAITRGIADIINAIGQSNIAGFFQGITKIINKTIPYIVAFVKVLGTAINYMITLFGGKVKKTTDATNKSMQNLGTSIGTTADNMDDASSSAKKLNKNLKQLAAFDEMNILQDTSDSGAGAGGGAGAGSLGNIDMSDFDTGLIKSSSKVDEITKRMMKNLKKIKDILKSIWDSRPIAAFTGFAKTSFDNLYSFYTNFGRLIYDNLSLTFDGVKDNLSSSLNNISELWSLFFEDLDLTIQNWGGRIQHNFFALYNSIWKDFVDPFIQTTTKVFKDFTEITLEIFSEYGKDIMDQTGEMINNLVKNYQALWDDILYPIIKPFLDTFNWLWDKYLKDMLKEMGKFISELILDALIIYNQFISPIIKWFTKTLSPTISYAATLMSGVIGTAVSLIANHINALFKQMKGFLQFITGVFTGDWRKAWEGVRNIFGGIFQSLVGLVKTPINLIIDVINAFISSLNAIKLPDWIPGFGGLSFHMNRIPKLAKGGIINMPGRGVPVGGAIGGERGQEGVIPLTDSQQMALLGEAIGKYITINANITNTMNGRVISKELQRVQNSSDFAFNR